MDTKFWHQKWAANDISFHESKVNPLLVTYFKALSLAKGSRVFVPLCGKTLDIAWLLSNGYRVAGAELSELAITQLFEALGIQPEIRNIGDVKHYSATAFDIFVGDIFDLKYAMLGVIDAIYDRAALVALPENMRVRYTQHVTDITDNAPQILITFDYDQKLMDGPPFSISSEEVNRHYKDSYKISSLISLDVIGGLKRTTPAKETVWLLKALTTDSSKNQKA